MRGDCGCAEGRERAAANEETVEKLCRERNYYRAEAEWWRRRYGLRVSDDTLLRAVGEWQQEWLRRKPIRPEMDRGKE